MRADHVIDFAAEELKKYLRMMMPRCGEIEIIYEPCAKDGFRLGLLEDFSLPCEAEDTVLDDVIHIDTDKEGGILAGSNPRSVLFAVYRFLRLNGCRWLYPGIDGEHVPIADIEPQSYHKMADHRFRGHCNEGAESQQCMLDTIDFYAKQELNVYMIEFDIPYFYYENYYNHKYNAARAPEPVSYDQVLQWKRQCEAEISKRGLQFHDMGHGWTAEPFGFASTEGWKPKQNEDEYTEEQRECLAMMNGKRGFFHGVALNTNVCMSNPKVRATMIDSIVKYAESSRNVDYLHVWLADGSRNHCECDECVKLPPSDYYLMIMNELDRALEAKGLETRIVFIVYVDTMFAPEKVKIENPKRFSLLYAPIFRSYSASVKEDIVIPKAAEYKRNEWETPRAVEQNLAFLREWQKTWKGPSFSYEYHYWRAQYRDPGITYISRRIYEDIMALKFMGLDGFVEDGSQRSFFPNGFHMYIYAEALMNRDCDYDAVLEDYFSHIYGNCWKEVKSYLDRVGTAFDFPYMAGEKSADQSRGSFYDPERVKRLSVIKELAEEGRDIAKAHLAMPTRPQSVSMRLLLRHTEYIEGIADIMIEKAKGNNYLARRKFNEFFNEFGKYECEIERYFDHGLAGATFNTIVAKPMKFVLQEGSQI